MTLVGKADEVAEGKVGAFQVEGQTIAVAHAGDSFYGFDDICTHRGCSLAEGSLDGILITCGCHGSVFQVTDGQVVRGPAQTGVRTYPVRIVAGGIEVSNDVGPSEGPTINAAEASTSSPLSSDATQIEGTAGPTHALSAVPLFAGLDSSTLEALQAFTFNRKFGEGELIVEEGRTGNGLFVVLSGTVEVVKGLDGPSPQRIASLGPGEPFGEMALLGDWKRSASVRAIGEVECLGMDRWAFIAHLNREPQLAIRMLQMLAERLSQTNEKLAD